MLCEREAVLNSRPLTYVSEDSNDLCPITPAMFLQGVQVRVPDIDEIEENRFKRRYTYKKKLLENFKNRLNGTGIKRYWSLIAATNNLYRYSLEGMRDVFYRHPPLYHKSYSLAFGGIRTAEIDTGV
ncbi:hypothetical protein NQ317_003095 [Molorchus minor]|uniref:Uncharacterized protein n=1 Tax=Molorchus minor TaxID=1323400 RepID=A0ABQ9IQM0_9CUCU|nr:hypothetical protein NQ317_003095 [Molorchus minor]